MKNLFFSFVLFLALGVYAQNRPNDLFEVHYDNENAGAVSPANTDIIIAVKFTADILSPYTGCNLTAVKVYIQNPTVGDTVNVKIYGPGTSTDPGELLWSSPPVIVDSNAWNLIPLPIPVKILQSDLWVGIEARAGHQGAHSWAGCDAGPNDPDGQYIYFSNAWYKLTALGAAFTYNWNIRAIIETVSNVNDKISPSLTVLNQNYPNPFNPNTTISFSLPHNAKAILKVYNILGQEVSVLLNGDVSAGSHSLSFNAAGLPGGIYFYRLKAKAIDGSSFSSVKKMLLIK
jgi:hypothetical protein